MNIRKRAYLLGLLPALSVALVLGVYLGVTRLADLEDEIQSRGQALTQHLAITAEYGVVSGNRTDLQNLLNQVRAEPDVAQIEIRSLAGSLLARVGTAAGEQLHFTALVIPRFLRGGSDPYLPDAPGETSNSPTPIASVHLGMSRARFIEARNRMLFTSVGIVLLGVVFSALLARGLALTGIRPIMELIAAARRMTLGDLGVEVPATAKSELRDLQLGFNQMSAALRAYRNDMQQQVDAATAELAAQKSAAEMANAAKSHFLAAASHDLRQPMHAIGLYVEAMKPLLRGRQAAVTLEKLAASVTALEGLFNAILDVSKLDAGAVEPQWQIIPLREFLQELAASLYMDAAHKGLTLRVRACTENIHGDPQLLERIMRNLVSNALRYTEHGGILISARRRGDKVILQVRDTGVGISAADLPRIFDEFYQVHNPARDRSQGLGLGLSIVRRLALLMDYSLSVQSQPQRGTVFTLVVPLCENRRADTARQKPAVDFSLMEGRIAVVDDDAQVLDALRILLLSWGLDVTAAVSGDDLCRQLEAVPDVLLTDWQLAQGETGRQVVEKLRAQFPGATIPVLVITGDISVDNQEVARLSALPALHKPVKPARLRAFLARMLRHAG